MGFEIKTGKAEVEDLSAAIEKLHLFIDCSLLSAMLPVHQVVSTVGFLVVHFSVVCLCHRVPIVAPACDNWFSLVPILFAIVFMGVSVIVSFVFYILLL